MGRPRREVRTAIVERESSSSDESSDEDVDDLAAEEEEEKDEEEEIGEEEEEETKEHSAVEGKKGRKKITISLKAAKLCKVCKGKDHQAGFVGSVYLDCPNRPCYLCKRPGHTTATCPHRLASEHGVTPGIRKTSVGVADFIYERQLGRHRSMVRPRLPIPNKVECGILKLHSRRVTCLEFHPTNDKLVISGDKKGQVGIWDYLKVYDKTVYETVHSCIVNSMKFIPNSDETICSSGSDGHLCLTDLETGLTQSLINLNPGGWQGPSTFKMIYGMDLNLTRNLALAADNFGYLYRLDLRTKKTHDKPLLIHKKGTKVVGLHTNPIDQDIFITSGNDHMARIWDLRMLDSRNHLAELSHPRVVSSAYFSPRTGNKIMTTCQDNRIRIWDCIFSNLGTPSREIVHSHDFNRYLTCFRAEWDPKDPTECLAVIGRYISDDFNGVALHPIDFIDVSTGQIVAKAIDRSITTISPVNKLHPRLDILASGSSRSIFIWSPEDEDEEQPEVKIAIPPRIYTFLGNGSLKRKGDGDNGDCDDEDELDECAGAKKKNEKKQKSKKKM
ncbi:DNA damage-binding protein 2 [Selaginella moellendorffii]|nr:DNA damage-binding protein 2 [Selaginella moellendorffii]|eukprot:XP_002979996.2 DNA damage-binding protein 2 [Selaginella moellendorffii]